MKNKTNNKHITVHENFWLKYQLIYFQNQINLLDSQSQRTENNVECGRNPELPKHNMIHTINYEIFNTSTVIRYMPGYVFTGPDLFFQQDTKER